MPLHGIAYQAMQKPDKDIISNLPFQARVIRFKDAPRYLGMSRSVFNKTVRPYVTVFPIGTQGIGFDRLELDRWLEDHMQRNGCPAVNMMGATLCPREEYQDSTLRKGSGRSTSITSTLMEDDFDKALAMAKRISTRRKRS